MRDAYSKKLRFIDDPIASDLIPSDCRDKYGVDAKLLVCHLLLCAELHKQSASDARCVSAKLSASLHAKEQEYESLLARGVEIERAAVHLAILLAKECHAKGDLGQDCWKCRLARNPHDCDKVTASDWLEYVRKEEGWDE